MQIVDIFSGIGGFSVAGKWMGWETVQFCEKEKFCQRVLKYYWPEVPISDDIKMLTADQIINNGLYDSEETTILVGGVPCQPWSTAGKRLGKADARNLWKESIGLAGSLHPDWIVFENVRGFTNWNGGMVFDQVQADLEAEGYEVLPFLLPACAVNAPHRRDRIWIIAHAIGSGTGDNGGKISNKNWRTGESRGKGVRQDNGEAGAGRIDTAGANGHAPNNNGNGHESGGFREGGSAQGESEGQQDKRQWIRGNAGGVSESGIVTNTDRDFRCEGRMYEAEQKTTERYAGSCDARGNERENWENFPTQSPLCSRDDELSYRLDGITFSKWRTESIKAYGNAVVPQLVFQIFKAIEQYES